MLPTVELINMNSVNFGIQLKGPLLEKHLNFVLYFGNMLLFVQLLPKVMVNNYVEQ